MTEWKHSLNKKKYQRQINKYVRILNKSISEDSLWKGRFFVRQVGSPIWRMYDDRSGGEYYVCLRFYDKKNLKYIDYFANTNEWCSMGAYRLFWTMNDFITKYMDVWHEEDPSEDRADYNTMSAEYTAESALPVFDWPLHPHR